MTRDHDVSRSCSASPPSSRHPRSSPSYGATPPGWRTRSAPEGGAYKWRKVVPTCRPRVVPPRWWQHKAGPTQYRRRGAAGHARYRRVRGHLPGVIDLATPDGVKLGTNVSVRSRQDSERPPITAELDSASWTRRWPTDACRGADKFSGGRGADGRRRGTGQGSRRVGSGKRGFRPFGKAPTPSRRGATRPRRAAIGGDSDRSRRHRQRDCLSRCADPQRWAS